MTFEDADVEGLRVLAGEGAQLAGEAAEHGHAGGGGLVAGAFVGVVVEEGGDGAVF